MKSFWLWFYFFGFKDLFRGFIMTKKRHQKTEKSHICHEILSYLAEHPDAKDTIEGIIEWWLLEQKIKHQADIVKEALEELINKGLIMERKNKNAHSYYQLNQGEYEKIRILGIKKSRSKKG